MFFDKPPSRPPMRRRPPPGPDLSVLFVPLFIIVLLYNVYKAAFG